jgi:hypothetical protein
VGYGLDLGTAGSGDGIAGALRGAGRQSVGRRCVAGTAVAVLSVVVI